MRLTPTSGADVALDRLLETPDALAIVDVAALASYSARHALPAGRLEFMGEVTRRCLVMFVQKGGWVHSLGELEAAGGAPPPTLGLAGADAAAAFELLRRLDGDLANITVSDGAPGPLAAQLERGALDAALMVVYPDLGASALPRLADNDRLRRAPILTRRLAGAVAQGQDGFVLAPMETGGLLAWFDAPEPTLCTALGVVLRDDAPASLREALRPALRAAAATLHPPGLADRAGRMLRGAAQGTADLVRGWLAP